MPIYRLNTKIRLKMLCLSGFELCSRWLYGRLSQFKCQSVALRHLVIAPIRNTKTRTAEKNSCSDPTQYFFVSASAELCLGRACIII